MSIVRRVIDRLTGVLGRDCAGKPLRKGDLVEPVPGLRDDQIVPVARCQMMVLRPAQPGDLSRFRMSEIELVLVNPDGGLIATRFARSLRKIPEGELRASWENLARITGWVPRATEQRQGVDA